MLFLLLASLATSPARAATFVKARLNNLSLTIETDRNRPEAIVTVEDHARTIDVAGVKAARPVDDFRLDLMGPGPMIAGHFSRYGILFQGDQVCGEVLLSPWVGEFLTPTVAAIAGLEASNPALKVTLDPACGPIDFASLAAYGWPLLVGSRDHQSFVTEEIRLLD